MEMQLLKEPSKNIKNCMVWPSERTVLTDARGMFGWLSCGGCNWYECAKLYCESVGGMLM